MLPEELRQSGFDEARRRGISLGEFIREAMRAALTRSPRSGGDAFLDDGAVYSGPVPVDGSTNLDEYLYGEKP